MRILVRNGVALALSLFSLAAIGEVTVKDAWVRGTVAAQTTTGAFMTITSSEEAKLVGARSSIAKTTEIHQSMLMDGVNHMHATDAVALPAGKPVELIIGEGFNHFEMQETIGNPYGIAGRAALKLMNLTMTLR